MCGEIPCVMIPEFAVGCRARQSKMNLTAFHGIRAVKEIDVDNKTAKIVRFHALGGPEVLKIEEVPIPEPGKGEVRLSVKAIGLNRAEVMFRSGQYLETPALPSKLGYEAAGVVAAVGPDVDKNWLGK